MIFYKVCCSLLNVLGVCFMQLSYIVWVCSLGGVLSSDLSTLLLSEYLMLPSLEHLNHFPCFRCLLPIVMHNILHCFLSLGQLTRFMSPIKPPKGYWVTDPAHVCHKAQVLVVLVVNWLRV